MDQTAYPYTNTPPDLPTPPKKPKKVLWLIAGASAALVILAIVTFAIVHKAHSSPENSPANSLTLYYRDGKTVLWQSGKDPGSVGASAPGFAGLVIEELRGKIGAGQLKQGAWQATTTLDKPLQSTAEQQIGAHREQLSGQGAANTALVAEDVTNGQVVAWAGGLEKATSASGVVRQKIEVGTLELPFTYSTLIENNPSNNAETMFDDSLGPLPGYVCTNRTPPAVANGGNCLYDLDNTFLGKITLRQALGDQRLVPAVQADAQLGGQMGETTKIQTFTEGLTDDGKFACYTDQTLSYTSQAPCYASATFGDGLYATPKDIIHAYATLANDGKKLPRTSLLKVTADGKVKYEWRPQAPTQAMRTDTARTINSILTDPNASYLSQKDLFTVNGTSIGVVPGVEPNHTEASAVEFSSKYAVGFWELGNSQNVKGTPEQTALPIVSQWMTAATKAGL